MAYPSIDSLPVSPRDARRRGSSVWALSGEPDVSVFVAPGASVHRFIVNEVADSQTVASDTYPTALALNAYIELGSTSASKCKHGTASCYTHSHKTPNRWVIQRWYKKFTGWLGGEIWNQNKLIPLQPRRSRRRASNRHGASPILSFSQRYPNTGPVRRGRRETDLSSI